MQAHCTVDLGQRGGKAYWYNVPADTLLLILGLKGPAGDRSIQTRQGPGAACLKRLVYRQLDINKIMAKANQPSPI